MSSTWQLEFNGSRTTDHSSGVERNDPAATQLFGLGPSGGKYSQTGHSGEGYTLHETDDHPGIESMFGALGIDDQEPSGSFFSPLPPRDQPTTQPLKGLERHYDGVSAWQQPQQQQEQPQQQHQRPIGSKPFILPTATAQRAEAGARTVAGVGSYQHDPNPASLADIIGREHTSNLLGGAGRSVPSEWSPQYAASDHDANTHISASPVLNSISRPYVIHSATEHPSPPSATATVTTLHQRQHQHLPTTGGVSQPFDIALNNGLHHDDLGEGYSPMSSIGLQDMNKGADHQSMHLGAGNSYLGSSGWEHHGRSMGSGNVSDHHNHNPITITSTSSTSYSHRQQSLERDYGAPHEEIKTSISPVMQPVQVQIIPASQTVYVAAAPQSQYRYAQVQHHYQPPQPHGHGHGQHHEPLQNHHHHHHLNQQHQQQHVHLHSQSLDSNQRGRTATGHLDGSRAEVHSRYMPPFQLHENYPSVGEYTPPGYVKHQSSLGVSPGSIGSGAEGLPPHTFIVAVESPRDGFDGHHHQHHHQYQTQPHHGYGNQRHVTMLRDGRHSGGRSTRKALSSSPRRQGVADGRYRGDSLLDEFKANKSRDWSVLDIQGHVPEFCQDQNGSRFIQQRLEIGDPTEKEYVLKEVLGAIESLRNDLFGNYVVQKLFDFGTPQMRSDLCATLTGDMVHLSLKMYGCRVVQKALEVVNDDMLPSLLDEFKGHVLDCIYDQNGNHVIQKCIEIVHKRSRHAMSKGKPEHAKRVDGHLNFVIEDVLGNVTSLSCHPYGCRVLQRILEHCEGNRKKRALMVIRDVHRTLLDDQYGNYVIQHVLHYGTDVDRDSVLSIVVENGLLKLSRQKFASNVVEKLLKHGSQRHRRAIVREMLKKANTSPASHKEGRIGRGSSFDSQDGRDSTVVLFMVRDAFANYVVQTALDVLCECEEKKQLLQELNSHSAELRNYTFAKHIVSKLSNN